MDLLNQEKNMESRETLAALSEGMADAVAKAGRSVVRVHGRRRRPGSGVVYAEDLGLTAGHVLEREEDLSVETADGRTLAARFVGRDHSSDLAVLRVEGLGVEAATPAGGEARVGQISLAVARPGRGGGRGGARAARAGGEARVGQISLAVASPGRGEGPRATFGIVSSVGGPVRTRRGPRAARRTRAHT